MIGKKIINQIFPKDSKRRAYLKKTLGKVNNKKSNIDLYSDWIKNVEPKCFSRDYKFKRNPLISIVTPCFNTQEKYINPLIQSVINQKYKNWELILVDGSDVSKFSDFIQNSSKQDKRIKYKKLVVNKGIVGNTNIAISYANGEFIAFLDHDDMLSPYSLSEVIAELTNQPNTDLFYSDEDKLSDNGETRLLPFFKPDWSPELLRSVNYITHFVVARKSIIEDIGYLRAGFDGAQDYDFLLRFTEKTKNIIHIPKILYHWRIADGSTAGSVGNKSYADDAGQTALKDYIKRNDLNAEVISVPERPTNYRLKYKIPKDIKASIIIPFKDKPDLLDSLVKSIFKKTNFLEYEIILVSNNSVESATHNLLRKLSKNSNVKVVEYNKPFNYSAVNNYGRSYANGDVLVFLNNDMEVLNNEWLDELVANAMRSEVGIAGGLLTYPDGSIQHAGVVLGMGGMAGHVFKNRRIGEFTEFGMPDWGRNYLAVTGACQAVKAKLFDKIGGYDEKFIICGSDVSLCLKLYEMGYQNIFCPYVRLTHFESKTVLSYNNIPPSDYDHSLTYYNPYLKTGDPYFNTNLDYMNESIGLRS